MERLNFHVVTTMFKKLFLVGLLLVAVVVQAYVLPDGTSADGNFTVDNIKLDTNTISTTDTNGNLVLSPDGTGEITPTANVIPDTNGRQSGSLSNSWVIMYAQHLRMVNTGGGQSLTLQGSDTSPSGVTTVGSMFASGSTIRPLAIYTASHANGALPTRELLIETGNQGHAADLDSGLIGILTGTTLTAGDSGAITHTTGDAADNSGAITNTTGTAGGTRGAFTVDSGSVSITSADSEVDFNSAKLTEVVDPTSDQDAATKKYVDSVSAPDHTYEISNIGLAMSVGSSALTIALKQSDGSTDCSAGSPCNTGFRDATLASGAVNARTVTGALSVVIPSGATMAHVDAVAGFLYVYLADNSGALTLAVSSTYHNELELQTVTAIGVGSDALLLYGTTLSTKPVRLIAKLVSTQTTAGTWDVVPTEASLSSVNLTLHRSWQHDDILAQEMFSARVHCDATPTIGYEKGGNWIASIAEDSTGVCTLTLNSVADSSPGLQCQCTAYTTSTGNRLCQIDANGHDVSSVRVRIQDDTGTELEEVVFLYCLSSKSNS